MMEMNGYDQWIQKRWGFCREVAGDEPLLAGAPSFAAGGCAASDLTRDGRIDLEDVQLFIARFTG